MIDMKLLFIITPFLFLVQLQCQDVNSESSVKEIFIDAIKTKVFREEFKICNLECGELNIFDFENQLSDFQLSMEICAKKVNLYNTVCTDHPAPNSIVIYKIERDNSIIKIYFWRPYSGAAVILTYRGEDKNIELINTEIGSF